MDPIDLALEHAWHVVAHRLKSDPAEARRRFARLGTPAMQRPMRAWCLCVRASDTRISDRWWQVEDAHAKMKHPPHWVWIDAAKLRELVQPVFIPRPGVDWTSAATLLGRHPEALRAWIKRGLFKVHYVNARSIRKRGRPVPFIYTPSPVDPNAERLEPPDRIWGDLWQSLHKRIPDSFEQFVHRTPRFRPYANNALHRFRGWRFTCQGRLISIPAAAPESTRIRLLELHRAASPTAALVERGDRPFIHLPCARSVDTLFCPLPVWTLAKSLGDDLVLPLHTSDPHAAPSSSAPEPNPPGSLALSGDFSPGLADPTLPGLEDWSQDHYSRSFACHRCWRVRYGSLVGRDGWNHFVSHLSGGLLRGQDVPRPSAAEAPEAQPIRKRRYRPHTRTAPPIPIPPATLARRNRTLHLLLQDLPYREIAARLGVSYITTREDIRTIYKQHSVSTKPALRAILAALSSKPRPLAAAS